jgi:hypothetical protein
MTLQLSAALTHWLLVWGWLQVGESLQVLLAPLEGLYDHLLALRQQHGWEICSRLLAYALALKQAQQLLA